MKNSKFDDDDDDATMAPTTSTQPLPLLTLVAADFRALESVVLAVAAAED